MAWPLVVRSPARDSHLCASITDDHSRVHFVHVFDAALTDKEGKEGGRRTGGGERGARSVEAAGWMMLVVGRLSAPQEEMLPGD